MLKFWKGWTRNNLLQFVGDIAQALRIGLLHFRAEGRKR